MNKELELLINKYDKTYNIEKIPSNGYRDCDFTMTIDQERVIIDRWFEYYPIWWHYAEEQLQLEVLKIALEEKKTIKDVEHYFTEEISKVKLPE